MNEHAYPSYVTPWSCLSARIGSPSRHCDSCYRQAGSRCDSIRDLPEHRAQRICGSAWTLPERNVEQPGHDLLGL